MTRFASSMLCVAALVSLLGCDDAKRFVKESKEGYQELEAIAGKLGEIAAAVKTNNFAMAKEFARELEPLLTSRVVSWTVQILAIEERDGVQAARAAIERFRGSDGMTASERTALEKLDAYYQDRAGRTGDLLVMIAAIAIEAKYGGHGTGAAFIQTCQQLRTQPSTNGVTGTNATTTP